MNKDYLDVEKCEAIARTIHEEMFKPLTIGELKEIIKDLPGNTRVVVSWDSCGSDTPRAYIRTKPGCKHKKILVIEG